MLVMWSANSKVLVIVMPRSRDELTTGNGDPLIKNGCDTLSLPICNTQHLLIDIDSCQSSAQAHRAESATCNLS